MENTTWENAVNQSLKEMQVMVDAVKNEVIVCQLSGYVKEQMMKNRAREEARVEIISNMIRHGMSDDEICVLAECGPEYVAELKAKL